MALRVYQAVLDVSHPRQNATKIPTRYADFLPFSVILTPFKWNTGLIENISLLQKTGKKRPQRDSILVGDTRTERTERVGNYPWPRRLELIGAPIGVAGHSIWGLIHFWAVAELQGLSLPREEQQSRRRSLLSALPVIGHR